MGIAEDWVREDRAVSIGINWATRSLLAWTGAGVSPEGPATHPPQVVSPSWQHLLGQNGGGSRQGSLISQCCRPRLLPDGPLTQV